MEGRKILVTGGGRGIGRAIARRLDAAGARLVLVGRDDAALQDAASELNGATYRAIDLDDRAAVDDLVAWCAAEHRDLAGLANNAAVQHEIDLVNGDSAVGIALARAEIALDLDAAITLSIGLLPILRRQPCASIVSVTTGLAFAPKEASPVYCAAKAGLHSFTQSLRYQCDRDAPHVRVTEAILPLVDTDMTTGRGRGKITADHAAKAIVDAMVAGRAEAWVGKAKLLRVLRRVPGLPERILRGDGATR